MAPVLGGVFFLSSSGCGYSQDEWEQKVRETNELRQELAGEQSARAKAEADYADALEEIDELRTQLSERGGHLGSPAADLEAQQKALDEYEQRSSRLDTIRQGFEHLELKLDELTHHGLKVDVRDNRIVIQLPGDLLFDPGQNQLRKEGRTIVLRIAEVIRNEDDLRQRHFQVAGHTDDRPIAGGRFFDNWGLSAMRARSVLVLLTAPIDAEGGGLPPENWSAAGYGSSDPVTSNDTPEGQSENRRIELVMQPDVREMLNLNSLARSKAEGSSTAAPSSLERPAEVSPLNGTRDSP